MSFCSSIKSIYYSYLSIRYRISTSSTKQIDEKSKGSGFYQETLHLKVIVILILQWMVMEEVIVEEFYSERVRQ
ncbi:hypothetical protein FPL18_02035 [Acinetobacter gyllenbergii]|nr:hypothetical protein FPL18_02035 [Acinetobacter gyllenbergii]